MMKTVFYKIECLTNLHVGSGDINYNIVDNEVEKDAITGLPVIHASGVKGALRDVFEKVFSEDQIKLIFGDAGSGDTGMSGSHKFLDACLLARPMRIWGSAKDACIPVVTIASVNRFVDLLEAFGVNSIQGKRVEVLDFGENAFLKRHGEAIKVENENTGTLPEGQLTWLKELLGENFAVVRNYDDYPLPVTARNCLDGKGNLWYEEVVPHGSVLYFAVIYPDGAEELSFPNVVQFGGNATIGCGYTKITKI